MHQSKTNFRLFLFPGFASLPVRVPAHSSENCTMDVHADTPAICIVMPIFNDWAALPRLLDNLAEAFRGSGTTLDVVLVNDVDADGEDDPRDAVKLVAAWRNQPDHLIAAQRTKRSESLIFRGFYGLYRAIFRLLTGHTISFGNFLLIPATLLPSVLSRPELIHHIAATLLRTRLPIAEVPTVRGRRYFGSSQMNVPALVTHAIGALSVFSDVLFSRLLIGAAVVGALCAIGSIVVASLRFFTTLAFPNWATSVISFLTLLAAQALVLILCLAFLMLTSRAAMLLTSMEVSRLVKGVRRYAKSAAPVA